MLAHSGIIHVLYGGFLGWDGVVGSLLPDMLAVIGVLRMWFRSNRETYPSWWLYMPPLARVWYDVMHTLPFFAMVAFGETVVRFGINVHCFTTGGVLSPGFVSFFPYVAAGYLTHIIADVFTHRKHLGEFIGGTGGPIVGVDWYKTRYYWTEWAGLGLVALLVWLFQWSNVLLWWV